MVDWCWCWWQCALLVPVGPAMNRMPRLIVHWGDNLYNLVADRSPSKRVQEMQEFNDSANLCQNCEEWARASYLQVSRTVGGNPNVHHPGIRVGWLEKHFPSDRQEEGSKWHCWCPTASARPWCRLVIQVQSIQGGTNMPSNPPSQLQST